MDFGGTMRPQIVFLDHTTAAGGAELALARTVALAPEEVASLIITPSGSAGAFDGIPPSMLTMVGPAQHRGAATLSGPLAIARYVNGVLRQGLRLRSHHELRAAQVVVANTARAAVYGLITVMGRKTWFVVHVRDEVSKAALGRLGVGAYRLSLKRADVVVANSEFTLSSVAPHLSPHTNRHVINSPIGMSVRAPQYKPLALARNFGMVARLDPWKGHALLIDAFHQAFEHTAEHLYFAGSSVLSDDSYLSVLRQKVNDLDMTGRVHFEGQLKDVAAFIDRMDVCVQCSLRPEPMGQNVLQYIARRRPVVAADAGGPLDFVRDGVNGVLFKSRNVDSLASALTTIAADKDLRSRIAGDNRSIVATDADVVDRLYSVLRGLLEQRPRSRRPRLTSRSVRRQKMQAA